MAHKKRETWWAFHPEKGKKGFATEEQALAWEADEKEPAPEPEEKEEG